MFFVFKLNDKGLAKKLDKELELNEKIQTMQAFNDQEGEIISLQRKDAQHILDNAEIKIGKFIKGWLVYITAFACALVILVTVAGFLVNREEEPVVPNDDVGVGEQPGDPISPEEEFEARLAGE